MHICLTGPVSVGILDSNAPKAYEFPMTAWLAREYQLRGHRVTVVTTSHHIVEAYDGVCESGIRIIVVPSRPRARNRALDVFRAERKGIEWAIRIAKPDVVHAHWTYEFSLAALSSNRPALVTVHDWAPAILRQMPDMYRFIRLAMQVTVLSRSKNLTAPSAYIGDRVRKFYRRDCSVIPNGIPSDMGKQAQISRMERGKSRLKIGLLNASDDKRKNIRSAVMAWALIADQFPEWTMEVAGPPFAENSPASTELNMLGLGPQLSVRGAVSPHELPYWFGNVDIFLHPSLEESFGIVLVEAMSAGALVVAGKASGGGPEVLGDVGVLADVTDASELAVTIAALLRDWDSARASGLRGIERARRFTIASVAEAYERRLYACLEQ